MPPPHAAQRELALKAPPRPEIAGCDVCFSCAGGKCARWRERQREWVATWQGHPPPESEAKWGDWWKAVKTQHSRLCAAAQEAQAPPKEQAPAPASAAGNAAGKRRAQADGTPNMGGQRKQAASSRDGGEGSSCVHSLILPPSQVDSGEAAQIAEAIEVVGALEIADATEAAEAAEAAAVAEAAEAAEAAAAAQAAKATQAAAQAAADAAKAKGLDPEWARKAAEYDAIAPELVELFKYKGPGDVDCVEEWNNSARDHAHYSMIYDSFDLEGVFAGAALELMRRKIDISGRWRKELCKLLDVKLQVSKAEDT